MPNSEKIAIAAHLHVLLRRKTGRVTDTEWMASNADYAAEIVRFARARAHSDGHPDLGEWVDKLQSEMVEVAPPRSVASKLLEAATHALPAPEEPSAPRYVRGIR